MVDTFINGTFTEIFAIFKKINLYTEKLKIQIKFIDEHIDEYLEHLFKMIGIRLEKLKNRLNDIAKLYKGYFSKYSGGSMQIFTRFFQQFKADIRSFAQAYMIFMETYEVGHQALDYYKEFRDWLDYFQILEQIKILYHKGQR